MKEYSEKMKKWAGWLKDRKKRILWVLLLLTLLGVSKNIYMAGFYNYFSMKSLEILENSKMVSTEFFLKLSGIKAVVAIIEGSSINFGLGLSGSVEFGDVVQPLYDFVDIIWKISLVNFLFVNSQTIMFKIGVTKLFTATLSLLIVLELFGDYQFVIKLKKIVSLIFAAVFFMLPTYTTFANYISNQIEEVTVSLHEKSFEQAITELEKLEHEINNLEDLSKTIKNGEFIKWKVEGEFIKIPKANINKELIEDIGDEINKKMINLKDGINKISKEFFTYFFSYLSLYLFNLLIIPLFFIIMIYIVKYLFLRTS